MKCALRFSRRLWQGLIGAVLVFSPIGVERATGFQTWTPEVFFSSPYYVVTEDQLQAIITVQTTDQELAFHEYSPEFIAQTDSKLLGQGPVETVTRERPTVETISAQPP